MTGCTRFASWVVVSAAALGAAVGQEPPAPPKSKVELRWVEFKKVEGLTEGKGFQTSCDPDSIAYPHKKPALVLTKAEVEEVTLKQHDFSRSGLSSENYMVTIHLTPKARKALADGCGAAKSKILTVRVEGKDWGIRMYRKSEADKFTPEVGFFSSRADAERLVAALK